MNQELGSGTVKLIFGGSKMSLVQYHPRDKDCAVVETLSLLMSNSDKSISGKYSHFFKLH
jgi:hypothetical protein